MMRWLNKKLGQPATPEVEILGSSIHQLSLVSRPLLLSPQNSAIDMDNPVIVARPPFPALRPEDLDDAIQYASLQSWLSPESSSLHVLSESNAAFGSHGYGLYQNYKSHYDCEDECYELPYERVYFVSVTRHALFASLRGYQAAFNWGSRLGDEVYLVDEMGGVDRLTGSEYPSVEAFWEYVRAQLVVLPRQKHSFPTKVILGF